MTVRGSYGQLLCQLCCLILGINRERKGESDYWTVIACLRERDQAL
jgi:hypothetical protein